MQPQRCYRKGRCSGGFSVTVICRNRDGLAVLHAVDKMSLRKFKGIFRYTMIQSLELSESCSLLRENVRMCLINIARCMWQKPFTKESRILWQF